MSLDRRQFLERSALGLVSVAVAGAEVMLTPAEARAEGAGFKVFTADEAVTLEALGETLLPGAAEAGIAHFVDHHLAQPLADSLLMIRYLDVQPPFAPFYQGGLAGLDAAANKAHGKTFAELAANQANAMVAALGGGNPDGWSGPPAPFFYFVTRADAVDVVYGTMAGFEKLGLPYLAHIEPAARW